MSDLTRFRDHCREMARAGDVEHRSLWVLLADEVDAYLNPAVPVETTDLWGQVGVEAEAVRDG